MLPWNSLVLFSSGALGGTMQINNWFRIVCRLPGLEREHLCSHITSPCLWAMQVRGTHFNTFNNYLTGARAMSNISKSKYLWEWISESSFTVPEELHIVMGPLGVIGILGWILIGWFRSWTERKGLPPVRL